MMDTDMRGVKREYRIAEWTCLIRECVGSGMTTKAWCEAHGIKKRKYYYWLRKVREAAIETSLALGGADSDADSGAAALAAADASASAPEFVRIVSDEPLPSPGCRAPAMTIRTGAAECVVYGGADPELVARALSALGARP
ncbi:MAG: hypothetical protein LBR00_02785 [Clostridiales Family XIII bacterium]|jgi:hypothetical protein|nr:hypothetical protein [Clostridiales Family XIII bacterium]